MTNAQYQNQSDEILCTLTASGDRIAEEALVTRYNRLVRICARPFFLAGGDSEDLIQEGMFGLLNAIREFSAGTGRVVSHLCRNLYSQSHFICCCGGCTG